MRTYEKVLLGGAGIVAAGLALPLILLMVVTGGLCSDEPVRELRALNGQRRATISVRDCGATTTWMTHLQVQRRTWLGWRGDSPVFTARPGRGMSEGPAHSVDLQLEWLDDRTLVVRYDGRAEVIRADTAGPDGSGVTVRYAAVPPDA